jgi:hypothetical protein
MVLNDVELLATADNQCETTEADKGGGGRFRDCCKSCLGKPDATRIRINVTAVPAHHFQCYIASGYPTQRIVTILTTCDSTTIG